MESQKIPHRKGSQRFSQDIVGEEHYQEALIRIAGPYTKEGSRVYREAVLYLQTDNPNDRNAIQVQIDGSTVGYISRQEAPAIRRQLQRLGIMDGQRATVDAVIGGGRIGTRYAVYLDYDELEDDELPSRPVAPVPVVAPRPVAYSAPVSVPTSQPAAPGHNVGRIVAIVAVVALCLWLLYAYMA